MTESKDCEYIAPVEPQGPVVDPSVKPIVEPIVDPIIEPPITPEESDSLYFEAIAGLFVLVASALGLKWRWSFIGLARYWWNKGHKMRAIKMFLTATKRAKDEFYNKK